MDLFQRGQADELRQDVGFTRPEAVHQPGKGIQFGDAVNVEGVFVEHACVWPTHTTACSTGPVGLVQRFTYVAAYAGFWICAIRTCCLKLSSIDSSSRTSVGRFTRVVIWSILSCNFSKP